MKSVQKIFLFIMISLCMASAIMATEGAGEAEQGPEEDITYPGSKFYTPEDNVRSKVLAGFADQIMRLLEERKVTGEPVHLKDLYIPCLYINITSKFYFKIKC